MGKDEDGHKAVRHGGYPARPWYHRRPNGSKNLAQEPTFVHVLQQFVTELVSVLVKPSSVKELHIDAVSHEKLQVSWTSPKVGHDIKYEVSFFDEWDRNVQVKVQGHFRALFTHLQTSVFLMAQHS